MSESVMQLRAAAAVLGRGRHSIVVADRFDGLDRALKISHASSLAHEATLLRALAHPHVVRLHAEGQDDRGAWLALERCECATHGQVPETVARAWLRQAAGALAHVHARGFVHRDVKPANLLVRTDGSLALADFGSAVRIGEGASDATAAGSPRHAAPEQSAGSPASPGADVYALGTVLHEWLTGEPAFPGETAAELAAQHLVAPIPRLLAPVAQWQPLLDAMLAKRPAARLADGAAVLSWKLP
ncbi:serine/threonine-protein kinase [Ramlibacter algicola]|uniref:non-specific serine/threonine protein kinase n=1 Tax=Ramlibacter algicola TaxID=2795217 RepID=A0A934Q123_9BURK|nr:serine/threonine-protein kinase [Ramlibacter algicola]MBK0393180.1 serine/threonine protein kinase [Ramlibacter algicola]